MSQKIYALIITHTNGYPTDQDSVKALGQIGDKFLMEDAIVANSSTTIYIGGKGYNSVNFDLVWEDGSHADIYAMSKYSGYSLRGNSE